MFTDGTVVRTGTFLYAHQVVCDLCIQRTGVRYGSGDYEDSPENRDDVEGEWYYIWYTPAGCRGQFSVGGPCFSTLEDASLYAEAHFRELRRLT